MGRSKHALPLTWVCSHPRPFSTGEVADQGCGADCGDIAGSTARRDCSRQLGGRDIPNSHQPSIVLINCVRYNITPATCEAKSRGTGARLAEGTPKGTAYARITVFATCVPCSNDFFSAHNSAIVRAIFHHCRGSHFSSGQLRHVTATATRPVPCPVLALHILPVCAYYAPACAYLALVCAFASLFVLTDTACLRARAAVVKTNVL